MVICMYYKKIKERLNKLIEKGEKALSTRHPPSGGFITTAGDFIDDEPFYQWRIESLSFLTMVFGNDSIHFQEFQKSCKHVRYPDAFKGQSILKAAKVDIESGYLKKLETLVSADIFTDFLEMSEYLLEQGYKDPAASLIGAVLENGLRKMTKNKDIKLKSRENISSLNKKLADAQTYNRLTQKIIQVWNEIRDNADHGNFSEYNSDKVKEMLNGVRDFLRNYL